MDHKNWLWRKKSSEKLILTPDKANHSQKGNEEEKQTLLDNKGELENEIKILKDKLTSALSECSDKDELVKKHETMMQEAVAGWEKAKVEIASLRQELDRALQQRVVMEERSTQLDAALKECMQQLRFVRDKQEQRIHDAVMKVSKEYEISQTFLEEKLEDTSKRLAKVGVENSNISKALLANEKLIEDLNKQRAQMETDFNVLMTRLDSKEKENASLKYEARVLEKELEIRNEEREFNRRTAEASHKQHLESVKKIAKLESECQRLRLLVRKRLPGPAALAKMKNEVQMLGRDSAEIRRRKSIATPADVMDDYAVDDYQKASGKRINILMEELCAIEEENKALKEALNKKMNELQFSRVMYAQTASKLSDVESRLEESSKWKTNKEPTRKSVIQHQLSLVSTSDVSSNDKVSCEESWASALISELENSRNGRLTGLPSCQSVGSSDINLMDDFVEMEKLALVSVDKPSGNLLLSSEEGNIPVGLLHAGASKNYSDVMPRKVVSVPDSQADFSVLNKDSNNPFICRVPNWLQDILKIILENNRAAKRNPDDILEDIKNGMEHIIHHSKPGELLDEKEKPRNESSLMDSSGGNTDIDNSLANKSNRQFQSDLSKSLCRIIELMEGINLPLPDYSIPETLSMEGNHFSDKHSETPSSYMVRVFQWKTSELSTVLQQFIHACYDLLNGKSDVNKFAQELTSALDWIMNHCFSLQDVSSMRDEIKKHLDWDESRSESEAEVGVVGHFAEADKLHLPPPYCQNALFQNELQINVREEMRNLSEKLINIEVGNKNLEEKLHSTVNPKDSLMNQLEESEKTIADLQTELETLKKANGMVEGQVEKHILINEDLNTQHALTKVQLNEACQEFPSAKFESENKSNRPVEPVATHLESVTKEIPNSEVKQEGYLRADWEISAASEKLAECQETILNLGKQLKALAAPKEAAFFDKVISSPSNAITTASATPTQPKSKMTSQRSSLLDQMLAEDSAKAEDLKTPKTKQNNGNSDSPFFTKGPLESSENILVLDGSKHEKDDGTVKSLAIVPSKRQGGVSLWRKLLWRKKKGNSKRTSLPVSPPQLIT